MTQADSRALFFDHAKNTCTLLRFCYTGYLVGKSNFQSHHHISSTIAYQGYGHRQNLDEISALVKYATGGLTPGLAILLDLDILFSIR